MLRVATLFACLLCLVAAVGCKKHPCPAIPITEPWKGLGLPLDDGIACQSEDRGAMLHHSNGDISEWAIRYVKYLENKGFTRTDQSLGEGINQFTLTQGELKINLSTYDYDGTGVRIDKVTY